MILKIDLQVQSLGSIWGFLQPFIFMLTYVIVFQFILKHQALEMSHMQYGLYQEWQWVMFK